MSQPLKDPMSQLWNLRGRALLQCGGAAAALLVATAALAAPPPTDPTVQPTGGVPATGAGGQATGAGGRSTPAIRLVWAYQDNYGCSSCQVTSGVIEVENLAYEKQVDVFYSESPNPSWPSVKASFLRSLPNQRELWFFERVPGSDVQLALRLRAAGEEHWDNNGGRNFQFAATAYPPASSALGAGRAIAVREAELVPGHGSSLTVKMMVWSGDGATNEVALVYSSDDWKTVESAPAKRTGFNTGAEYEEWTAQVFPHYPEVRFAAVLRQDGGESWDNGFGMNYFCGGWVAYGRPVRCVGGSLLPVARPGSH